MKKEKKRVAAELQLHSDQSFQYTSHGYFKLSRSCGITLSMSRKVNPYNNAMAEKIFFCSENRMYLSAQTKCIGPVKIWIC